VGHYAVGNITKTLRIVNNRGLTNADAQQCADAHKTSETVVTISGNQP
jgi:hypothetical protein